MISIVFLSITAYYLLGLLIANTMFRHVDSFTLKAFFIAPMWPIMSITQLGVLIANKEWCRFGIHDWRRNTPLWMRETSVRQCSRCNKRQVRHPDNGKWKTILPIVFFNAESYISDIEEQLRRLREGVSETSPTVEDDPDYEIEIAGSILLSMSGLSPKAMYMGQNGQDGVIKKTLFLKVIREVNPINCRKIDMPNKEEEAGDDLIL